MKPPPPEEAVALGIDLGSTRIKIGWMDDAGRLAVRWAAFPAPQRKEDRCEGDALAVCQVVEELLDPVIPRLPAGCPLGIASQRSSFLLWEGATGQPATPLISWQDRRATGWCARHAGLAGDLFRRSGLVLSPHHAGPKLAAMQEANPELESRLHSGKLRFGTLETFLAWRLTAGRLHATDVSMAGRTGMMDLDSGCWSPDLLRMFDVPEAVLPAILPSAGRAEPAAGGLTLAATLADQAAGALSVLDAGDHDQVFINGGTGTFLLRAVDGPAERRHPYLIGPLLGDATGITRYALEATVNSGARNHHADSGSAALLPATDPSPQAFCLPDETGLGAPYWRPDMELTLSPAARQLGDDDLPRIILEGVLFRCAEILEALLPEPAASRILVSGGLSREPEFGVGLAALLGQKVEIIRRNEGTLTGTVRLAAGLDPHHPYGTVETRANGAGAYLPDKYVRWRRWMEDLLR